MNFEKKRLIVPIIALLAFLLAPLYKNISKKYIDNTLKDAVVTYATLRGINAGVSVIKNSSVGVSVGVDGNIAIGKLLDPIDDAVERFSDMITLSLWVLGSEKILFELSQMQIIYIFLIFLAIGAIISKNELFNKLLIILIFLKLFIPFSAVISDYTNQQIFTPQIEKNLKVLNYAKNKKIDINFLNTKNDSWWGSVKNRVSGISNSAVDLKNIMLFYIKNASKIIDALINLSMLYFSKFLLNLILLPLAFVYIIKNIEIK
jgi:hypothetical protein